MELHGRLGWREQFADAEAADAKLPTFFGRLYQTHDGQFDIREVCNAAKDPDLSHAVGWVPSLYGEAGPAYKLQALASGGSGPFAP
jgi:hypothetical protein